MVDEEGQEEAQFRADLREDLARELHDAVAGQLQAMLVEMELLKRRGDAPGEIEEFQVTTRQALGRLRETLYHLRHQSPDSEMIQAHIERKVSGALATEPARRRHASAAKT
jgi:signal transduction histidine kinase